MKDTIIRLSGLLPTADSPRSSVEWGEAYNPRVGDIWLLKDGRYMVVDYKDSFLTGVTWSDGEQKSQSYTQSFGDYIKRSDGELISTWEQKPYPGADNRGWTDDVKKVMTREDSISFIQKRLQELGREVTF